MIRDVRGWIGLTTIRLGDYPAWRHVAEDWGLNRLPSYMKTPSYSITGNMSWFVNTPNHLPELDW